MLVAADLIIIFAIMREFAHRRTASGVLLPETNNPHPLCSMIYSTAPTCRVRALPDSHSHTHTHKQPSWPLKRRRKKEKEKKEKEKYIPISIHQRAETKSDQAQTFPTKQKPRRRKIRFSIMMLQLHSHYSKKLHLTEQNHGLISPILL